MNGLTTRCPSTSRGVMMFEALILLEAGHTIYIWCVDGAALVGLLDNEGRTYIKLLRVRALAPC